MASFIAPKSATYTAGGTIVEGHAVKMNTTDGEVIECTANTDPVIGIALNSASSGSPVEVAHPGGGAKAKLGEAVAIGLSLVSHTDGTLVKANASGDMIIAQVLDNSGTSGDMVEVLVYKALATAADV